MTKFTHKITSVKTYSKNGLDDIVHTVRYELEGELNGKKQTSFMPITFSEPDPSNFTNFASLTEDQVLLWVKDKLGEAEVNALMHGLDSLLKEKLDPLAPPLLAEKSLPWTTEGAK
jgi:hypothetical protein